MIQAGTGFQVQIGMLGIGDQQAAAFQHAYDAPAEGFSQVYMRKLFDRGYQMALKGYHWEKAPPGFLVGR